MQPKEPNENSNDFANKANLIIENIRSLKKSYAQCLFLDKEFHELKTITIEINRNQLKYNFYINALDKQQEANANFINDQQLLIHNP